MSSTFSVTGNFATCVFKCWTAEGQLLIVRDVVRRRSKGHNEKSNEQISGILMTERSEIKKESLEGGKETSKSSFEFITIEHRICLLRMGMKF